MHVQVVNSKEVIKENKTYYPTNIIIYATDNDVVGVGTYFLDRKYPTGFYYPKFTYYKGHFVLASLTEAEID
jgi:hypothetical protein